MTAASLCTIVALSLGQAPVPAAESGMYVDGSTGSYPAGYAAGATGTAEQLYPFDAYEPWVHGYWQEMPAYGGFHCYRPYNYKHLLSQSQVAGGWGMSPTMPYSHEYFRRGREQTTVEPATSARQTPRAVQLAKSRGWRRSPPR